MPPPFLNSLNSCGGGRMAPAGDRSSSPIPAVFGDGSSTTAVSPAGHGFGPCFGPASSNEAVLEIKIADFINEFLSSHAAAADVCSSNHAVSPRRRMSKGKRYRGMWRLAVRSLMRKQGLTEESRQAIMLGLPNRVTDREARPSQLTSVGLGFQSSRTEDPGMLEFRNSTIDCLATPQSASTGIASCTITSHEEESFSKKHQSRESMFNPTGAACLRSVEDRPIAWFPNFSKGEIDRGRCHSLRGANSLDSAPAKSMYSIVRPTCKKPPRPPTPSRLGCTRSFKRTARESTRVKRRKAKASSSSVSSFWAMIITLCFAIIMVIQGFHGRTNLEGKEDLQAFSLIHKDLNSSSDQQVVPHQEIGVQKASSPITSFVNQIQNLQPSTKSLPATEWPEWKRSWRGNNLYKS